MGKEITIECVLLANIIIISVLLLPGFFHIIIPTGITIGFLYSQKSVSAWGTMIPAASTSQDIFLAFFAFICFLPAFMLRKSYAEMKEQQRLTSQLYDTISKLTGSIIGFQQVALLAEEKSKAQECNRITREIHDSIGYNLTTLMMLMEAALQQAKNSSEELRNLLRLAKDQAKQGLSDTRQSLRILRSVEVHKVKGLKAVHKLVTNFQMATGITIKVEYGNMPIMLEERIDNYLYRIVQEGITNSFRHGKATFITICFQKNRDEIFMYIQDNGIGCKNVKEGVGLAGMRERLESVGGEVETSVNQTGFKLTARIPYKENGSHG